MKVTDKETRLLPMDFCIDLEATVRGWGLGVPLLPPDIIFPFLFSTPVYQSVLVVLELQ